MPFARRVLVIILLILLLATLALSLSYRWWSPLPAWLAANAWLQTLADLMQLLLWVGGGAWLLWRWARGAPSSPTTGVRVRGNVLWGKRNKIIVQRANADVSDNILLGEGNEARVEEPRPR